MENGHSPGREMFTISIYPWKARKRLSKWIKFLNLEPIFLKSLLILIRIYYCQSQDKDKSLLTMLIWNMINRFPCS